MCTGETVLDGANPGRLPVPQSPVHKHQSSAGSFRNDWHSTGIAAACQRSQALLISRSAGMFALNPTRVEWQLKCPVSRGLSLSPSLSRLWIAVITFDFPHACGWLTMRNAKANSSIYLTGPKNSRAELRWHRKWNQLSPLALSI